MNNTIREHGQLHLASTLQCLAGNVASCIKAMQYIVAAKRINALLIEEGSMVCENCGQVTKF